MLTSIDAQPRAEDAQFSWIYPACAVLRKLWTEWSPRPLEHATLAPKKKEVKCFLQHPLKPLSA
jgi:hypothetical protein